MRGSNACRTGSVKMWRCLWVYAQCWMSNTEAVPIWDACAVVQDLWCRRGAAGLHEGGVGGEGRDGALAAQRHRAYMRATPAEALHVHIECIQGLALWDDLPLKHVHSCAASRAPFILRAAATVCPYVRSGRSWCVAVRHGPRSGRRGGADGADEAGVGHVERRAGA